MGCGESHVADQEDGLVHPRWRKVVLDGKALTSIPKLSSVDGIETVSVANNKLDSLATFKSQRAKWHALTDLNLSRNEFETVPRQLSSLKNLTRLNLSCNPITDVETFGRLGKCSKLRSLDLAHLRLRSLPEPLVHAGLHLTSLSLASNARIFVQDSIQTMQTLTHLNISRCSLVRVPPALAHLEELADLDLSGNPLAAASLTVLQKAKSLRKLSVARMLGWGQMIPKEICTLTQLTALDLSQHGFSTYQPLEGLPQLESLDVSCSWLTTMTGFGGLKALRSLDLSNNSLTTIAEGDLPCFLESLKVFGNSFTQPVRPGAPLWRLLSRMPRLKDISFRECGGRKNVNPYSTKIPLHLLGLPLERINGIPLNPKLTQCTGSNMANIIKNGYFKLDMGVDWETRLTFHISLLKKFHEHFGGLTRFPEITEMRYRMFLSLQQHAVKDRLIAPLDVALYHYIHMTQPASYAADCLAMFDEIVDNHYHGVDRSASGFEGYERLTDSRLRWAEAYGSSGCWSFDFPFVEWYSKNQSAQETVRRDRLPTPDCLRQMQAKLDKRVSHHKFQVVFRAELVKLEARLASVVAYAPYVAKYTAATVARFYKFLAMKAIQRDRGAPDAAEPLLVTPAMSLVVKTLHCMPAVYSRVMRDITGPCEVIDLLDVAVDGQVEASVLLGRTSALWQDVWGEEYTNLSDPYMPGTACVRFESPMSSPTSQGSPTQAAGAEQQLEAALSSQEMDALNFIQNIAVRFKATPASPQALPRGSVDSCNSLNGLPPAPLIIPKERTDVLPLKSSLSSSGRASERAPSFNPLSTPARTARSELLSTFELGVSSNADTPTPTSETAPPMPSVRFTDVIGL